MDHGTLSELPPQAASVRDLTAGTVQFRRQARGQGVGLGAPEPTLRALARAARGKGGSCCGCPECPGDSSAPGL